MFPSDVNARSAFLKTLDGLMEYREELEENKSYQPKMINNLIDLSFFYISMTAGQDADGDMDCNPTLADKCFVDVGKNLQALAPIFTSSCR